MAILGHLFLLLACAVVSKPQNVLINAPPTPLPELSNLPREAGMECSNNPELRGAINIWELPGIPLDYYDDSETYEGDRGQKLGTIKDCAQVIVIDYTWSKIDQEFYVYIKSDNSEDWLFTKIKPLEGWVSLDLVDLNP